MFFNLYEVVMKLMRSKIDLKTPSFISLHKAVSHNIRRDIAILYSTDLSYRLSSGCLKPKPIKAQQVRCGCYK